MISISQDDIEKIRSEFQPVDGSKLATALNRCETALNRLQTLETRAALVRSRGAWADGFMSRLVNHAVDLATVDVDILTLVKDAQAIQTAVSAIEATARTQIQQARERHQNESETVNNLAKLLYEAKRDRRNPGRLSHLLTKYAGHPAAKNGGMVDRVKRRVAAV